MSKLKSPLLSLGAEGTIADAITFQKRGQATIVREKPIPTYRRTLPQVYQRWLYEDYAYLWTQQTAVIKRQCAATGSRFHLTGFQYWMKLMLATLPDIAGMWHLDEKSGTIAKDFSKNANNGTIYGATPVIGIIDYAQSFDGLNDYVSIPNSPSLCPNYATWEFRAILYSIPDEIRFGLFCKDQSAQRNWFFTFPAITQNIFARIYVNATAFNLYSSVTIPLNTWFYFAATYNGTVFKLYPFGNLDTSLTTPGTLKKTTLPLSIGRQGDYAQYTHGLIDEAILYNRALDPTEIKRHSLRRYPP